MIKRFFLLMGIALVVSFASCSGTKGASPGQPSRQPDPNYIEPDQAQIPLETYLRRIPGVYINGDGRILIRGLTTLNDQTGPLVMLDQAIVSNQLSELETLVEVNDIASVRVLKDAADTAMYGTQANNGVILIKTKRQ